MFYDAKFGRKKVPEETPSEQATANGGVSNGGASSATANGNGHVKNQSDLAIYERYRNQVVHLVLLSERVGDLVVALLLGFCHVRLVCNSVLFCAFLFVFLFFQEAAQSNGVSSDPTHVIPYGSQLVGLLFLCFYCVFY